VFTEIVSAFELHKFSIGWNEHSESLEGIESATI